MEDKTVLACGHEPTWTESGAHAIGEKGERLPYTTGTATIDGIKVCHPCAEVLETVAFAKSENYFAYLSNDGRFVVTWTGGILARVSGLHKTSSGFGGERYYFRAKDNLGQWWSGNGPGEGMYCRLKRLKN